MEIENDDPSPTQQNINVHRLAFTFLNVNEILLKREMNRTEPRNKKGGTYMPLQMLALCHWQRVIARLNCHILITRSKPKNCSIH